MRYSESLENVLRQSQAFRKLRANLHSWISPKTSISHRLENLHRYLGLAFGQEKLLDFISDLAFIPREHLLHASIMEQRSLSLVDRLKLELEVYTKLPWDWWPLNPPSVPLGSKSVILAWKCVSLNSLKHKSPTSVCSTNGHCRTVDTQKPQKSTRKHCKTTSGIFKFLVHLRSHFPKLRSNCSLNPIHHL